MEAAVRLDITLPVIVAETSGSCHEGKKLPLDRGASKQLLPIFPEDGKEILDVPVILDGIFGSALASMQKRCNAKEGRQGTPALPSPQASAATSSTCVAPWELHSAATPDPAVQAARNPAHPGFPVQPSGAVCLALTTSDHGCSCIGSTGCTISHSETMSVIL